MVNLNKELCVIGAALYVVLAQLHNQRGARRQHFSAPQELRVGLVDARIVEIRRRWLLLVCWHLDDVVAVELAHEAHHICNILQMCW